MDFNLESMFQPNLINVDIKVETKEDLFKKVGLSLQEKGYVNEHYIEAIIKRETDFPTGLITKELNVALPHSDTEYVKKPFIYVARLKEASLTFNQMGDNQKMKVKDIFFLGIKDNSKQVNLLAYLMELFSNDEFVSEYQKADNSEKIYDVIKKYINKKEN